jgi:periplasmic protein TonB
MFEDSTFESRGSIHTRSRGWMIAALAFNGSILLALILIPLIYPEAFPRFGMSLLMTAPPPPQQPRPHPQVEHATVVHTDMPDGRITAPPRIPKYVPDSPAGPEILDRIDVATIGSDGPAGADSPFRPAAPRPVVHQAPKGPVRIAGPVEAGLLLYKKVPVYPQIAIEMRIEGTVVLQATISKSGTIENLRVVSGPAMLQQAALDAVQSWRYRPYQLDNEPIEVETTVNVVFTLGR